MKPMQYDIERHSPARLRDAYLAAAETEEHNPFVPPESRAKRAEYFRERAREFRDRAREFESRVANPPGLSS